MTAPRLAHLFEPPPADGNLTVRQALALAALRRTRDGMPADELGAILHSANGKHTADNRCGFCLTDGRSVASALRKRGLTVRRVSGFWQATNGIADPDDRGPGALPEGF